MGGQSAFHCSERLIHLSNCEGQWVNVTPVEIIEGVWISMRAPAVWIWIVIKYVFFILLLIFFVAAPAIMRVRITLTYWVARWLPINYTARVAKLSSSLFNTTVNCDANVITAGNNGSDGDELFALESPPSSAGCFNTLRPQIPNPLNMNKKEGMRVNDVELWIIKW